LRRLRIAASVQLPLAMSEAASTPAQRWLSLPDEAQAAALSLLARMIADGVIDDEGVAADASDR
jgi:hypothetical protein